MNDAEMRRIKDLPQCAVCGKKSDAAKPVSIAWLCGTDFDAWMRSAERGRCQEPSALSRNFMDFVARRRAEALNGVKVLA